MLALVLIIGAFMAEREEVEGRYDYDVPYVAQEIAE